MSCMKKNSKLAFAAACGIVSALVGCGGPGAQSPSVDADGGTTSSTTKDPVTREGPSKEPGGGAEKSSCGGGGHSH